MSQAWAYLIEAMEEHARTLALLAGAMALLTCAGVACLCYCRARRRTRLWAGELASRMATRRRSKGHAHLRQHDEEGSWGCGDAFRLGQGEDCSDRDHPGLLETLRGLRVVGVACGVWHTLARFAKTEIPCCQIGLNQG